MQTVRIARLTAPRRFEVGSEPLPAPPPGHVRVRIAACGVCASELHAVEEPLDEYPARMGHEPVGVVEALGEDVRDLREGDRVTGGFGPSFADRVNADRRFLVRVPEGLGTEDAIGEPLGCVVEGLRRTRVGPDDRIAVVGAGYMGSLMLQLLLEKGAGETVVVDPRADVRSRALAIGAKEAVAPDQIDTDDRDGPFDVVVEATGTQAGLDLATGLVRQHGVLSILGYHQGPRRSVDLETWNWKAIDVVNAHVRRRNLLNDAIGRGLELTRLGRIHPGDLITHRFGLDEVGEAFEALATKPAGFVKAVVLMDGG
jgi:threonine dehydrogenase-like Zn-dependent dehydrogenase